MAVDQSLESGSQMTLGLIEHQPTLREKEGLGFIEHQPTMREGQDDEQKLGLIEHQPTIR